MKTPTKARFARALAATTAPAAAVAAAGAASTTTPEDEARMRAAAQRVAEFRREQADKPYLALATRTRAPVTTRNKRLERQVYLDELDDTWRRWMRQRAMKPAFKYTREEKATLRDWFMTIDADGSGEIDADELADPLLSTGVARTFDEVEALMELVDADGSGEIGFEEFIAVLKPSEAGGESNQLKKLREELEHAQDGVLPMTTLVTQQRRQYLLDAIMGSPDDLAQLKALQDQEQAARKAGDLQMLARVRQQRIVKDEEKKENHRWLQALEQCVERNRLMKEQEEAEEAAEAAAAAGGAGGQSPVARRRRSSLLIQPSASELTETKAIAEIEAEMDRNGLADLDRLREERDAALAARRAQLERAKKEVHEAEQMRRLELDYVPPVSGRLLPSISVPQF